MILYELIDYSTLKMIWWLLLGVLLIGFAVTDGFDMGVGALLPFVGETDVERRVAINTIGATWEGNQVWFILGGGAIFAAWPPLYAISFSGFYLAMFVVLAAMILRPVAFKYRSKRPDPEWRNRWDWALFTGSFVPALVFGVAVGNVLLGVPFTLDPDLRMTYEGSFFGLFSPFSLLCGLLSVCMLVMHGGAWLGMRAGGVVAERGRRYGSFAAIGAIVLFGLGGFLIANGFVDGQRITSDIDPNMPANPLWKTAVIEDGAWMANYAAHPILWLAPALGFLGAFGALVGLQTRYEKLTFLCSKLSVFGIISTVGVSMFPFLLPSSVQPDASLTVWDSASSHATLFNMLVATIIFLPIILVYTAWVYKVLWGKVDEKTIERDNETAY
ncbi:cytochrome bd-I ubiquinol oxidase subunit 2 apoprotein [Roseibium hamelinense]|uniref:Cytochrome bd-I ubiquinol oxidase subunit 2 apoprotein n=1 Tax=Roseibium hamelinense TaxID=150831 RepID=A0A562T7E9_9HYPH|nr:cytochrome d ubiquinol oxidase subunit II [Roseibium hamelinense]MTI42838.1 cytochrome d ubiquinol oxidase subunit II [Roseibium hamelinense]TWI89505.1 cytochrome bd-I ubiquinol oxidase subunit 2 apoprotein [Roseibium hamelinense]